MISFLSLTYRQSAFKHIYTFLRVFIYKIHTHITFNGPFSRTTQVSRYQKGKTNLDFTEARDSEWQWHQLGHMQVCTSLQTDNHASTQPLSFFTGRMPFLPPNQQLQSTEGIFTYKMAAQSTGIDTERHCVVTAAAYRTVCMLRSAGRERRCHTRRV